MAITLATPIFGPMDVDRIDLITRFGGEKYPAAIVSRFADALIARSEEFGIRASIVAGQIAKETGWFRFGGQVAPGQYNLAGLGATNDGAAGVSFPDIETGVLAVFVHHLVYTLGKVENWPEHLRQYLFLDQRYIPTLSTGRAGSVHILGDYTNGNWAYNPSFPIGSLANGYAQGIRDYAELLSGGMVVADFPTMAEVGFPVRLEPTTYVGDDRALSDILWYVQHDTEGYYENDIIALTKTQNGSAHFIIGREWGQLVASVPIRTTAWTPGNNDVAAASVNVEMSGFADGRDGGYTDWQYFCNGVIYRWCQGHGMVNVPAIYIGKDDSDGGILPDHPGILGHQDVPDGKGGWGGAYHHTDPGPHWDWGREIAEITGGSNPVPHPTVHTIDGVEIGEGFWQLYESMGEATNARLRDFGILRRGDHDAWLRLADGRVISVVAADFERGPLIWDRGATSPPWDVRRPLATELLVPAPKFAATRRRGKGYAEIVAKVKR